MRRFRIHREFKGAWTIRDRRHQFATCVYGLTEPRSYWWVAGRRKRITQAVKADRGGEHQ